MREAGLNVTLVDPTPFGPLALVWERIDGAPLIVRVILTRPGLRATARLKTEFPDAVPASCQEIETVAADMRRLLAGEDVTFSLDLAAMGARPSFQQAVLRAEHAIPRGRVSTYGLIARRLGRPGASRAVGNALATNPFPIIVPCHRAVRSEGRLGGYQGGPAMKRALLEREGVPFDRSGRVAVPGFHYS
jgi:methylated-DNA-[protein]-cysteine S-methyltransferase